MRSANRRAQKVSLGSRSYLHREPAGAGSFSLAHPFTDHLEHRRVEGIGEFDPRFPFLDPGDRALDRFDAGERDPDDIVRLHPDRYLDAAPFRREVENVDAPAVFTGAAEIDVCAKRHALRPARVTVVDHHVPLRSEPVMNLTGIKANAKSLLSTGAP